VIDAVRSLLGNAAGVAHARLGLLGEDLRAERSRLGVTALLSLALLYFAALGIAFLAFTVMIAAWDHFRLGAAAGLATLFLAGAGWAAWRLRAEARTQPRLFDATLSALERDRERLARPPAAPADAADTVVRAARWAGVTLMLISIVRRVLRR